VTAAENLVKPGVADNAAGSVGAAVAGGLAQKFSEPGEFVVVAGAGREVVAQLASKSIRSAVTASRYGDLRIIS